MKFLTITTYDVANVKEIAAVSDKLMGNMPKGYKPLAAYMCLGQMFPGLPPLSITSFNITESDSAEAMASVSYQFVLAGATMHRIPVMEMPLGDTAKMEKELGR